MNIEKTDHKRRLKTLWIISLTLIPISLISYLYLLAVLFVGGIFMSDLEIINKTDTLVRFSPYGKISTGETCSLPIYSNSFPYFPKIKSAGFFLRPNESKRITYDTDDGFFEGLIIETDNLVKDYKQERFEIKDRKIVLGEIQSLPNADKLLTEKVLKIGYKNVLLYFLFFTGLTNSFFFLILKAERKRYDKYGL